MNANDARIEAQIAREMAALKLSASDRRRIAADNRIASGGFRCAGCGCYLDTEHAPHCSEIRRAASIKSSANSPTLTAG